jgi:hypothetical protein
MKNHKNSSNIALKCKEDNIARPRSAPHSIEYSTGSRMKYSPTQSDVPTPRYPSISAIWKQKLEIF